MVTVARFASASLESTRSVAVVLLGCCLAALLAAATTMSAAGDHPSDPDGPA